MLISRLVVKSAKSVLRFLKGRPLIGAMFGDLHQHDELINDLHSLSEHTIIRQEYPVCAVFGGYVSQSNFMLSVLKLDYTQAQAIIEHNFSVQCVRLLTIYKEN